MLRVFRGKRTTADREQLERFGIRKRRGELELQGERHLYSAISVQGEERNSPALGGK